MINMKKYNTEELLETLEQQTDTILNSAVQQWQMINPAMLKQQPAPGAWSAMQCLGHLNAYGRYYLPAIEKAIDIARMKRKPVNSIFTPGWLGNYFTKLMLPSESGGPVKMKAPKNYTISNEGSSDEVLAEFIVQQEKLLVLLHQARRIDLNKIRIPVSIAKLIKLKLGDVFMFLIAHNIRHVNQAERAMATAKDGVTLSDDHPGIANPY
jgi:hypothetical protein